MPFLTHGGVTLRYDRTGSGPAVLFIHGWTCNRTFWERQVQAIRDRFTAITVDLRGHGESSAPRTGYTMGAMAADLEHLLRTLAVSRVAIVGWSMGGLVAQELARRLGDRAAALALVCTTAGGLSDPKRAAADPERFATMQRAVAEDFRGFIRGFAATLFKEGEQSPLLAWAVAQTQKTPPHVAEASLASALDVDLRPHLADLRLPTAVLHGRHDAVFPLAEAEVLAAGIPGARLTVFEESGHAPFLEEPEAFNAALGALLEGKPTGAVGPAAPAARAAAPAAKPTSAPPKAPHAAKAPAPTKPAPAAKPAKTAKPAPAKKNAKAKKPAKPK